MAKHTIVPLIKMLVTSSQDVSCIKAITEEQPTKKIDTWYTFGFPNPEKRSWRGN
jgi:hypothetical protein